MTPAEFKAVRKELSLTQGQLASVIGLNGQSYISQIETGMYPVTDTVARLMTMYLTAHRIAPELLPSDWPQR